MYFYITTLSFFIYNYYIFSHYADKAAANLRLIPNLFVYYSQSFLWFINKTIGFFYKENSNISSEHDKLLLYINRDTT